MTGFRNSFSPGNKDRSETKHSWFSTFGGMLAALAAFITAIVSLANSCSAGNKAIADRLDKIEAKVDKSNTDINNRIVTDDQALKQQIQDQRETLWEYYRRLEMRVDGLEPGYKELNKKRIPPPVQ